MKAFIDGNAICVVKDDFVNLQESDAVFIEHVPSNESKYSYLKKCVDELNSIFAAERKDGVIKK